MHCYRCHSPLDEKITFRSTCENCNFDLHVCLSCKFYLAGKANDCFIPDIDKITDKEKNNFCEEFVYQNKSLNKSKEQQSQIAKKLFKDADENDQKNVKSFEDLFKK